MKFNSYAGLKDVSKSQSYMVIGEYFLIRILIGEVILNYTENLGIETNDVTTRNAKIVASVLYNLVMDIFRGKNSIIANNQAHLPPD
jgi:hypothetical protein